LLLGALAFALGCHPIEWFSPGFEAWSPPGGPAVANALAPREPCEHRTALRQPFFGDLHVHTALSMDTTIRGGTSTPDEAYRFARGEAIGLPPLRADGQPTRTLKLRTPLDFAAVTDHAEWLGETSLCKRPDSDAYDSGACRVFRGESSGWIPPGLVGNGMFLRIAAVVGFFGRSREICGPDAAGCRAEVARAWDILQEAAERHQDRTAACRFTTFHAWEYSAAPRRSKVHRNVILRNEIVPELPISWIDEPDAAGLWRKLDERCNATQTGCEAIAIPHNPNLSNG